MTTPDKDQTEHETASSPQGQVSEVANLGQPGEP
ncbi:MAG: hypothetical protein JWP31_355, partial [Aeromicrobium sp.]|nr:hypothetical protein [Aeromicrobium sp.]